MKKNVFLKKIYLHNLIYLKQYSQNGLLGRFAVQTIVPADLNIALEIVQMRMCLQIKIVK